MLATSALNQSTRYACAGRRGHRDRYGQRSKHRYATTIEFANAARDAITEPIARPTPSSPPLPPGLRPIQVRQAAATKLRQPQPVLNTSAAPVTGHQADAFASPVVDYPSSGQTVPPVPTPKPRRPTGIIVAVIATIVVLGVGAFLLTNRRPSQTPVAQTPPLPSQASSTLRSPPPAPGPLNGLLLSVDQINTAMGTAGMTSVGTMTDMPDNSFAVSDQACLPLSAATQAKAYAGSGYTAVQAQIVAKPQQNTVDQAVVSFPSAQQSGAFFTASTQSWAACSDRQFTLSANGNSQQQTVGPVANTDGTLSATVTPANSLGVCERALTVANNIAVDVTSCFGPRGAAVSIAHQIAAKVH